MSPGLQSVMDKLAEADLPVFEGVALTGVHVKGAAFGDTPLHVVAIWGDVEAAQILMNEGAEVDARGEHGFTPLHEAVSQGHVAMVALLLKHGADPTLLSDLGDAWELVDDASYPTLRPLLESWRGPV